MHLINSFELIMNLKKVLITFLGLIVILFGFTSITGYSIIIDLNSKANIHQIKCLNNSINPFEKFNFDSDDNWEVHLVFDLHDVNSLPKDLPRVNYLMTSDTSVLNSMKNNWNFKCSNGDMATVESKLLLKKNDLVVFETGIHITDTIQGLQSKDFGWIQSNAILYDAKRFNRTYMPIIII